MARTRDMIVGDTHAFSRRVMREYGSSPSIGTAFREIWDVAGAFNWRPFGTTDRVQVSSSSGEDAAAGTGAKTVVVAGIDPTGAELEQSVTLTGTTPVELPIQLHHVNRAYVTAAGSGAPLLAVNVGDIYVSRVGAAIGGGVPTPAGDVYAKILAGKGRTASLCYVVPAGHEFRILGLHASVGADATMHFRVQWQEPGGVVQMYLEQDVKQAQLLYCPEITTKIPGGSRVIVSAKLSTGSDEVHAEIAAVLA